VQDGPELDVDFWIMDPNNQVVVSVQKSGEYEHTVEAKKDGRFTYCFHNLISANPPKLLSFYNYRDDYAKSDSSKGTFYCCVFLHLEKSLLL
jgi:hypothetical protein